MIRGKIILEAVSILNFYLPLMAFYELGVFGILGKLIIFILKKILETEIYYDLLNVF